MKERPSYAAALETNDSVRESDRLMSQRNRLFAVLAMAMVTLSAVARAGGWPMYRADAGRTGYTSEKLPAKLSLRWTYKSAHPPVPAWPMKGRISFDRAQHLVSDGRTLYFGSSADCKVYALDAATGRVRWTFFTGAPVRFAPALWKDRVLAVSDDGYLYCLSAADGKLLWKKRGGPSGRMVLGNGRMICKWPARGGPVVVGDTVYFGAGIWPADGIYIYALEAATGKTVWVNDKSGAIPTKQPHRGGIRGNAAVSCQGYLVAAGDKLFVPTGRSVVAAFNRADGKLLYYHLARYHKGLGGSAAAVVDSRLFNSGGMFDTANGDRIRAEGPWSVSSSTVSAAPRHIFFAAHSGSQAYIYGMDRAKPVVERERVKRGKKVTYLRRNDIWQWRQRSTRGRDVSLIALPGTVIFGGRGSVSVIDIKSRKPVWTEKIDGVPLALAVAGGRLFVGTDRGDVYCFGRGTAQAATIESKPAGNPYPDNQTYAAAAEEIIKASGLDKGYCLDLGCGEGELMFELARRTKLRIYGVEKDPAKVAAARRKLDAAGLYGVRVTILQGDPAKTDLPNYFANLVVSGNSVTGRAVSEQEALRCRRPWGGIACTGKPGAMTKTVRGPLKGAGNWTHQYANAANTTCSDDELIKGPLTMLWFGVPSTRVADRHARPPAPLFAAGRLYVQGLEEVRATDAYNGRMLWKLPLKSLTGRFWELKSGAGKVVTAGVPVAGGNMCVSSDGKALYVHNGKSCLRVDGATGKTMGEFKPPPDDKGGTNTWGFLAIDHEILFGSVVDEKYLVVNRKVYGESKTLFALNATNGKLKWRYEAKQSIRHNAIAVGGGTVYLIDRPAAPMDRVTFQPKKGQKWPAHPPGTLLALDAATGRIKWKRTGNIYGTMLALSTGQDVLLMSYQPSGLNSEVGGRMAAFRASTGKPIYDVKARYRSRLLVNGQTIYGTPGHRRRSGIWNLLTGEQKPGRLVAAGSCGILAGGKHIITFRGGSLAYVDLRRPEKSDNYGGARPGCWINAIPAGGLVLMPEYSDGCTCSYQIKTSLALESRVDK
jgi:outer membrane protein assembly factor BamB